MGRTPKSAAVVAGAVTLILAAGCGRFDTTDPVSLQPNAPAADVTAPATARPTSPPAAPPTSTPPTSAPAAPPTSTPPTSAPAAPPKSTPSTPTKPATPPALRQGATGPEVASLQRRLAGLNYHPGAADGTFGVLTTQAVWAFQHVNGLPADGVVGAATKAALANPVVPRPRHPVAGTAVEVDLARQVLVVYRDRRPVLVTHVSTGSGQRYCVGGSCSTAVTPTGAYRFFREVAGWDRSPLGVLYNPIYFNGGIAVHGGPVVPNYPDSHGCVRVPMAVAPLVWDLVSLGNPIWVDAGR